MNYYERHIGDYIKDTVSLTMLEDGAYNRLIDQCYQTEKPLPLDRKEIYREARANSSAERKAVDYVLGKFFDQVPTGYVQKRIDSEIARYQDKQRKAKASADARWNKDKPHSDGNANASESHGADDMRTHTGRNALQSPVTSPQSPIEEEPPKGGPVSPSAKTADQQALIDGIPKLGQTVPQCPHDRVLTLWAELLPELPQPVKWTDKRRKLLQTRWREAAVDEKWGNADDGLRYFAKLFRWVKKSKFLTGQSPAGPGRQPFTLDLEWLLNATNWLKVIEGKYHTEE